MENHSTCLHITGEVRHEGASYNNTSLIESKSYSFVYHEKQNSLIYLALCYFHIGRITEILFLK